MKKKLPTLQEMRDAHAWKREYERYLPASRFLFRPAGFWITWFAIRIGLTSEQVSWFSGFIGLSGCVCLASGQADLLPWGIALLLFFNLLDCVDGSIARSMKTGNPYGIFLDSICGNIVDMIFWGVVGLMAFQHPDLLLWPGVPSHGPLFWLLLGVAASYLGIYLNYIEKTFDDLLRTDFEHIQSPGNNVLRTPAPEKKERSFWTPMDLRTMMRIVMTNLRVRETFYLFLVLAYVSKTIDLLIGVYFLFYLLDVFILIIIYSRRGASLKNNFYQSPGSIPSKEQK